MLSADDIFNEVLSEMPNFKYTSEIEIPILYDELMIPTPDDFLNVSFSDENTLNVCYGGQSMKVPCDINMLNSKPKYVARCIMYGFVNIVNKINAKNESKTRKNTIRLTESRLRSMIHETIKSVLNENDEKFNIAMKKLFLLAKDWGGMGENIREFIVDWFGTNDKNDIWKFVYDEEGMFHLLRMLMGYDFFWVPDGKVDIKNANEPEVARLIYPFVTPEMGIKAVKSFFC